MQDLTPTTTETKTLDLGDEICEYTESTWTFGDYTLTVQDTPESRLKAWEVTADATLGLPTLRDANYRKPGAASFQVNWSSMGSSLPEDARDYANLILEAAAAAEYFNRAKDAYMATAAK